jgi:hypothetical protein
MRACTHPQAMLSRDMAIEFDEINIMDHGNVVLKRDEQYILVCC